MNVKKHLDNYFFKLLLPRKLAQYKPFAYNVNIMGVNKMADM